MAASINITNSFGSQTGPIPTSQLDTNFTQLATAVNTCANFTNYAADSGTANAYVVTFSSPAVVTYVTGLNVTFKAANDNTTASTLNVNSLGAKSIVNSDGSAIVAGQITSGSVISVTYDGTNFQLVNSTAGSRSVANLTVSSSLTLSGGTANGVTYLNSSKVLTTASLFTYNSAGNLSVGAPSSGTTLSVDGGSSASNTLSLTGSYNGKLFDFNSSNANGSYGTWSNSSTANGYVGSAAPLIGGSASDFAIVATNNLKLGTAATGRITVSSSGNTTITGSAATTSYSLGTTGATLTIDCTKSNVFYTTLTSATNVTTVTLSNPSEGQTINIFITQPASGTVATMISNWAKWPGGAPSPFLTASTSAIDLIVATYRGGTWYATISKAFA